MDAHVVAGRFGERVMENAFKHNGNTATRSTLGIGDGCVATMKPFLLPKPNPNPARPNNPITDSPTLLQTSLGADVRGHDDQGLS